MRTILILTVIFFACACKSTTLSISGSQEKAFISQFLDTMMESNTMEERPLHQFIDPEFLSKKGLKGTDYLVDAYSLQGFNVESYKEGVVTALIWGQAKNWQHRLQFKLHKEKGQLYIVPSDYEDEYVTPWWSVERDVSQ